MKQHLKQNNFGIESTMSSRSIWIPCFKKSELYHSNNIKNSITLNDMQQIEIKKESQIQHLDSIEQLIDVEMKYDNNYNNGIKLKPTINDIVIENSFLLSIINLDILSETTIPTIFTTIINKNTFLKDF